VRLRPVALALVTVAVAQQKRLQAVAAAALVVHGVGARAAQIADGFIGRLRHVDGRQFARAVQASQAHRVAFVGLDPLTRARGDHRRRHHRAGDLELPQAPGDAEAARPRFIAGFEARAGMGLAQFGDDFFEGMEVIADLAVQADLALEAALGYGDHDRLAVDIETQMECSSFHGVFVVLRGVVNDWPGRTRCC
jgi:hypothetical protein